MGAVHRKGGGGGGAERGYDPLPREARTHLVAVRHSKKRPRIKH